MKNDELKKPDRCPACGAEVLRCRSWQHGEVLLDLCPRDDIYTLAVNIPGYAHPISNSICRALHKCEEDDDEKRSRLPCGLEGR